MRTITIALVAAMLGPGAALEAQTAPLSPGARVRVTTSGPSPSRQVGSVLELREDSLVIRPDGRADSLAIPLARVTDIELSRGLRTQGRRGLGVGFLVGAGAGVLIGLTDGDDPPGAFFSFSAEEKALMAGSMLGVAGAVVGGLVGLVSRTEKWSRVPLGAATGRVGVAPRPGGVGLSVSLRF